MSKRLRKWLTGTRLRKILGIRLGLFHQYAARTIDVGAVDGKTRDKFSNHVAQRFEGEIARSAVAFTDSLPDPHVE